MCLSVWKDVFSSLPEISVSFPTIFLYYDLEEHSEHKCYFSYRCGSTGGRTTLDPWLWCRWWATSSDWVTGELLKQNTKSPVFILKSVRMATKKMVKHYCGDDVYVFQASIQFDVRPVKRQDPTHRLWRLFWSERRFVLNMLQTFMIFIKKKRTLVYISNRWPWPEKSSLKRFPSDWLGC